MSTPDSSATPYERGLAHLKRHENAEALAAFTEAIRLDPEGPNAYIGRALIYSRLGDKESARLDEKTAQRLGGPERTAWDRLVNGARRRWRGELGDPDWARTDPLSRNAVLLRILNGQILNGGLHQWLANGYAEWVDDTAVAAKEVGTPAAREVAAMLEEVSQLLKSGMGPVGGYQEDVFDEEGEVFDEEEEVFDQDDDSFAPFYTCEDRYYRVQNQFVEDVENWAEKSEAARDGKGL